MLRHDFLTFDDINSKLYGVGIYGDKLADSPQRDMTIVSVPGKNGDVVIDNKKFKNITITYHAYIINDYVKNIRAFRDALMCKIGYFRLEDTINDGEYRIGIISPITIKELGVLRAGEFDLKFNCKPQRFLKSGEEIIEINSPTEILNLHNQVALPKIRAYGTGNFTINGIQITITSADDYTDIDCDLMEAYKNTLNFPRNNCIILNNNSFPSLKPGLNTITFTGLTKLEIEPRWWIL